MAGESSSPPLEHWSVRLDKIPFPWLRKNEKNFTAKDEWRPWHNSPNPIPTIKPLRRSQRLIKKEEKKKRAEDCVLYPPYYGIPQHSPPPKKKRRTNPFLLPKPFNVPPPSPKHVHFTEAEKKEMLEELLKNPPLPRRKKYKASADYVATHPLLTEVNDATLAVVGWVKK